MHDADECSRKLIAAERRIEKLLDALARITNIPPAIADGSFFREYTDQDGEYLGSAEVDPLIVVQEMVQVAMDAISQ